MTWEASCWKHCFARWFWSLRMDDDKIAALPSTIAFAVEKAVCGHRRERKILWTRKPKEWKEKLMALNNRVTSLVYNLRQGCLATSSYVKRNTTLVNGRTEFINKGTNHELLRVTFQIDDSHDPTSAGTYFLSSAKFPKRAICCVSTTTQPGGFDILRENYTGQEMG